jgi:hypothetical protein
MKNLSRKDDLALTRQGMGGTPRTDELHNKLAQDLNGSDLYRYHKMKWLSEEIERELNQAIRDRDQARSNVKPMGAVTIARNGYIQEIEAQRDQAIKERDQARSYKHLLKRDNDRLRQTESRLTKERDKWKLLAQRLRDLLAPLAWLQAVTHPNRAEIAVAQFDVMNESQSSSIDSIYEEMEHCRKERDRAQSALRTLIALHEREIKTGQLISGEDWEIAGCGLGDE